MTTGPDNLGNGAAKTEDRFAGQLGYRPRANRDGGSLPASPLNASPLNGGPLSGGPLNGGPLNGSPLGLSPLDGADDFGSRNGAPAGERLGSPLDRSPLDRSPLDRGPLDLGNPIASTLTQPKLAEPDLDDASLPDVGFRDSGYRAPASWLDGPVGQAVVDHPLLRGLLLELPPKGATLQAQWLDRWFEAARSILELLYRFEDERD